MMKVIFILISEKDSKAYKMFQNVLPNRKSRVKAVNDSFEWGFD